MPYMVLISQFEDLICNNKKPYIILYDLYGF